MALCGLAIGSIVLCLEGFKMVSELVSKVRALERDLHAGRITFKEFQDQLDDVFYFTL